MSPDDDAYRQARAKARRRPAWLLRRREAQIAATRPRPSDAQIAELRAVRAELRVRAVRPAPMRWWGPVSFYRRSPGTVVIHKLPEGRWKVSYPDGLTSLTVDDDGTALACVPTGWAFEVIEGDP